jgi:outer membrane protein assembly complex protein YaeT
MTLLRAVAATTLICLLCCAVGAAADRDAQRKWLSKRPVISQIVVEGNSFFSDGRIKRTIRSKQNGFWQSIRLRQRHRLKKDSRSIDLAAISYLYRSNGFADAKIEEEFDVADDSSAIIRITIEEGRRLFIRGSYSPSDLGVFADDVWNLMGRAKTGQPYNSFLVSHIAAEIKTVYANDGYPYAVIKDSAQSVGESDSVDVVFSIDRGPLTLFGEIRVDSLEFTKSHTFVRELTFKPDDIYSRQRIVDSRQRVYSTGLASYVDLSAINATGDSLDGNVNVRPDFKLRVRERTPKFARIKTGAGQDKEQDLVWDLGLEFGNRNISGKGRQVKFEIFSSFLVFASEWRILKERFDFEYTEPWLLKTRMPLTVRFGAQPGIRSGTQRYRISQMDLDLTTGKEFSRSTRSWAGAVWQKVNITGIPAELKDSLQNEEGISVRRKLIFGLERDTRNNLLLPISGSYFRFDSEYVGGFLGGDESFIKLTASVSRYQNFYGSNVYAWNYRFGWAAGIESDPYVPTTDRFYFGGGKSLRGYPSNSVGPLNEKGDPEGGRVVLQTNQEIRRPLFWKFWGSAFVDIGNNYEDFEYIKFDNLLASGGVGLQYISPVGPVRVDYGHRLVRDSYPAGGRFHFSILYAF